MSRLMRESLNHMSVNSLMNMVTDIRSQASTGLISKKEAHDQINDISSVVMRKQLEEMGIISEDDYEDRLWKEPEHGGMSEGDDLMTNGWEK
jgi:hypothetical protein